jgi:hypothetical protein
MAKLTRNDLYSLETYAEMRNDFRNKVMAHKKNRRLELGDHVVLHFEDQLIMHYQVQEMLRAEKIFESSDIEEELNTYNPLIPDGSNWKATMMIQYSDVDERKKMLARLKGIDNRTWVRVKGHDKVFAISDEDMERESEEKTSAVHFMRFELSPEMITDLKNGTGVAAGIDHETYRYELDPIPENISASLIADLE